MTLRESNATKVQAQPADHAVSIEDAVRSTVADILSVAGDPALTEDLALALLNRPDLTSQALERLCKNSGVMKSRKVKIALIGHPKTPRHVSLPMVRHLYAFDLMKLALTPVVPADIKVAADDALVTRLETVSLGQKLSLARRASGRIAGALLLDAEARVVHAALENAPLTEASVIKTLMRQSTPAVFVESLRLTEARERLTLPDQTIESVALSVGFKSADAFRRAFEKRYGIKPTSYRKHFSPRQRK